MSSDDKGFGIFCCMFLGLGGALIAGKWGLFAAAVAIAAIAFAPYKSED